MVTKGNAMTREELLQKVFDSPQSAADAAVLGFNLGVEEAVKLQHPWLRDEINALKIGGGSMNYLGAVLYFWLAGSALLLLFKLLHVYPTLAGLFFVTCLWVAWELYRESQDQHNPTRKQ